MSRKALRGNEELASWRFEGAAVFHGVGTVFRNAELRENVIHSRDPEKSVMDQAEDSE